MIEGINLEAEKDYISVILNSPEILITNADKVRIDLFCDPFHQKIISKVRSLLLDNRPVEVSTISNNEREQSILYDIKDRRQDGKGFETFYKILEECLIARELKNVIKTIKNNLTEADNKEIVPSEVLHKINIDLDNLEQLRTTSIFSASEIIESVVDRYLTIYKAALSGETIATGNIVQTPFHSFNKLLKRDGLSGGNVLILAAPTSTGKTEFALNLMAYAGIDLGKKGFIYSLEMAKEPLVERILLERSRVDSFKLERGGINDVDIQRLKTAAHTIKNSGLIFEDNLSGDIFDVITSIRKAHYKYGLDIVMIDYLQLIKAPTKQGNRNDEIATISRMLKQESTKLNIPFIVLSQLSRKHLIEGREPALHDLRDSGAIEQDADLVLFLYATMNERRNQLQAKTKGILAKQREGSIGEFFLMNNKTIQSFQEISPADFKKGQKQEQVNMSTDDDNDLPF